MMILSYLSFCVSLLSWPQ